MKRLETKVLEPEDTMALMKSIAPERSQKELQEKGGADFGFAFGDLARFRVSIFKQKGYVGMVLRQIPNKLLSFERSGHAAGAQGPDHAAPRADPGDRSYRFGQDDHPGRGMIDYLNDNARPPHHHDRGPDRVLSPAQEVARSTSARSASTCPAFAEAIRRALRQDPDIILVGEMRDLETIEAAITAAETGHIVFGTLHTTGAQGTVNRIIDVFPTNQQEQIRTQLSTSVIGILSQALLPKIGGGRVAAYEMLVVTPAIANLIRENKTFRITSSIQTGQKQGMQLLDDHLFKLWQAGPGGEEGGPLQVQQRRRPDGADRQGRTRHFRRRRTSGLTPHNPEQHGQEKRTWHCDASDKFWWTSVSSPTSG